MNHPKYGWPLPWRGSSSRRSETVGRLSDQEWNRLKRKVFLKKHYVTEFGVKRMTSTFYIRRFNDERETA